MKLYSNRLFPIFVFIALVCINWSCIHDIEEMEKYKPKDWLKGKLYEQMLNEDDLTLFTRCVEITGYDTVLNTSGSFTIFAPTDAAFADFFQNHPVYNSIEDIPVDELTKIVEYQIINDAWSIQQLQSLDIHGWIDTNNSLQQPRAFKRISLYRPVNKTYPARHVGNRYRITEQENATTSIKAFTRSNRYSPIFFDEYFNIHSLTHHDYEFYFGRKFESNSLFFANAKFDLEIPAENGFVYKTDKVITPLLSAEEIMEKEYGNYSFKKFLALTKDFSEFNINLTATYAQAGAREGLDIDTLYNLSYPELLFDISNELTGNINDFRNTYRDHHGLLAPTDQTFESFINEYISPGWGSLEGMPLEIKRIIINSHMSENPIYPTNFLSGFINGSDDRITLSESDIIHRSFGSNSTFMGLNKTIIPRAFESISRPIYLRRNNQIMMYAVEFSRVLSTLKRADNNYTLYLPGDFDIGLAGDSSLVRVIQNPELNTYFFETYDRSEGSFRRINRSDLRKKILNQVAVRTPTGMANKEFIQNLAGNYIVVDHMEGTVSGTAPTTYGYRSDSIINLQPKLYDEPTDNGLVYEVETFFSFIAGRKLDGLFLSRYLYFYNLLVKAGLYDPVFYRFPFLTEGEFYTVFVPSAEALTEYGAQNLPKEELKKLLQYHFVRNKMIFTDGSEPAGIYSTTRVDESSTTFLTKFSNLNIVPHPDVIRILDKNGNVYVEVNEDETRTNQVVTYNPNTASTSLWDYYTSGVVHEIDKVLVKELLHTD